jgi:hypothetical protein
MHGSVRPAYRWRPKIFSPLIPFIFHYVDWRMNSVEQGCLRIATGLSVSAVAKAVDRTLQSIGFLSAGLWPSCVAELRRKHSGRRF